MLRAFCARALTLIIAASLLAAPDVATAQGLGALIVKNDMGGRIEVRMRQIALLKAEGRPVELRGEACVSACTMYLGLDNVCVDPRTTFGFHGPSNYGRPLPKENFEYWSKVLATYYKKPLSDWFTQTARFEINGLHTIPGTELIRIGYRACPV